MENPTKENCLREVRKLNDILNTHGNCIVPSLNDKETTAIERLNHFLVILRNEYNIQTEDQLWLEINELA